MKTLDDLNISPTPWSADEWEGAIDVRIRDADDNEIAQPFSSYMDATLMSSAPTLYIALLDLIEACHQLGYKDGGTAACCEAEHNLYNKLWAAESALREAGGINE